MTELYLISGFMGAGKTTFLMDFAPRLAGRRLSLIVNEFGKARADARNEAAI